MKHLQYKTFILFFILTAKLFAIPANAQANDWHYGFKLAYFKLYQADVDDPDNVGLVVNYNWDNTFGSLGIEAEATSTFENGHVSSQDIKLDTAGVFGVYRSNGMG